jgi:glycerol-3-phosphate dehydrogenase (NAD(P)+)
MNEKILILGKGEIGLAIGKILAGKGFEIYFWDKNPERTTQNMTLQQMVEISGFVFLCVPSWALRNALESVKSFLKPETVLVSLAKGMESTGKTIDAIIKESVSNNFVLMSGPMLAEEISQSMPGFAAIAAFDAVLANKVQNLFKGTNIHTEISGDVKTVAFAGVLKNVYALILGIASGLGYGDNVRGFLISKILEEWNELADLLKLDRTVLAGVAGQGDFVATSISKYSKNRELGEKLVQGKTAGLESEGLKSLSGLVGLVLSASARRAGGLPIYLGLLKKVVIDNLPAKEVFGSVIDNR